MITEELFTTYYNGSSDSLERALLEMRNNGVSIIEVAATIKTCLNVYLPDADRIVLNSKAWNDYKSESERVRKSFGDILSILLSPPKDSHFDAVVD